MGAAVAFMAYSSMVALEMSPHAHGTAALVGGGSAGRAIGFARSSVRQRGDSVCRYAITSRRSRVLNAAKGGMRVPYRPSWITRSRSAVVGREPYRVELNL